MILKGIQSTEKSERISLEIENWPNYKNAPLEVICPYSSLLNFIDKFPLRNKHRYILLDLKIHNLEKDVVPALPFWHSDSNKDPSIEDEVHHLYVKSKFCLTEFLKEDVELRHLEKWSEYPFIGEAIESERIYTYTNQIHRAVQSKAPETRLLIRLTETNKIKPNRRPFNVTYARTY